MKRITTAILLVACFGACAASENISNGNTLYEYSLSAERMKKGNNSTEDTARAFMYMSYIAGVTDAMNGGPFCTLDQTTRQQAMDVVAKFLESRPEIRHLPSHQLVIQAMQAAHPCPTPLRRSK